MTLFDSLRPHLARLLGNAVAAVCAWLFAKYALDVDAETQRTIVDVILIVFGAMVTRDVTHRMASKKINPNDAASKHLAVAGVEHREAIRLAEDKIPR